MIFMFPFEKLKWIYKNGSLEKKKQLNKPVPIKLKNLNTKQIKWRKKWEMSEISWKDISNYLENWKNSWK